LPGSWEADLVRIRVQHQFPFEYRPNEHDGELSNIFNDSNLCGSIGSLTISPSFLVHSMFITDRFPLWEKDSDLDSLNDYRV
jgi:hypothetical protein